MLAFLLLLQPFKSNKNEPYAPESPNMWRVKGELHKSEINNCAGHMFKSQEENTNVGNGENERKKKEGKKSRVEQSDDFRLG